MQIIVASSSILCYCSLVRIAKSKGVVMQVAKVDNTSFKALNSNKVLTPRAKTFVEEGLPKLQELGKYYDVTLSSDYIPFGFGDEILLASVKFLNKKTGGLRNLFHKKTPETIVIKGCTSVVDLVDTAIANSAKDEGKNVFYKIELRDPNRKGLIRVYSKEQIQRLKSAGESDPSSASSSEQTD